MGHHNPWKTIRSRTAYKNDWIHVREDAVIRPDGRNGIYGVVEMQPSVGVVALNDRREIVLVGQWRYPTERYSWEIPRGGAHPGESDLVAVARRELLEEAGVHAAEWLALGTLQLCNGVARSLEHVFLATRLSPGQCSPDPEEEILVRWIPFDEAVRMALDGDIEECTSVAAILRVQHRLSPNGAQRP